MEELAKILSELNKDIIRNKLEVIRAIRNTREYMLEQADVAKKNDQPNVEAMFLVNATMLTKLALELLGEDPVKMTATEEQVEADADNGTEEQLAENSDSGEEEQVEAETSKEDQNEQN